jgi:hypothetical protein
MEANYEPFVDWNNLNSKIPPEELEKLDSDGNTFLQRYLKNSSQVNYKFIQQHLAIIDINPKHRNNDGYNLLMTAAAN